MLTVIFVLALTALLACGALFVGSYIFADDRDAQWQVHEVTANIAITAVNV